MSPLRDVHRGDPRAARPRRGGGGGEDGGGGGGGGFKRPQALENLELGRLAMLAAGILVVILVLVLLARSCGGSSAESKNEEYLNQVKAALKKSSQAGVALNAILRAPRPLKSKAAVKQVKTAHDLMQQALNDASAIEPTKQAEAANPALIQALSYRVNGLQCLQQNLPQAYQAKQNVAGGKLLAPCMQRLLASDVVYADSLPGAAEQRPVRRRRRRPRSELGDPATGERQHGHAGRRRADAAAAEAGRAGQRAARDEPRLDGRPVGWQQRDPAAGR